MKMKTHKAVAKRFKMTKTGKVKKRTCGQAHFNARECGKVGRNKRRAATLSEAMIKHVTQKMPYA